MFRVASSTVLLLAAASTGCAAMDPDAPNPEPIQGSRTSTGNFAGTWSVKWCDGAQPDLECGGFSVTLVQHGDRLCGNYGSALVNQRQTDDGNVVGTALGNVAVLAAQSGRSGATTLIRARLVHDRMHWEEVAALRSTEQSEIDIIAHGDFLERTADSGKGVSKTCTATPDA